MSDIYEPREDSFLLEDQVRKLASGVVLDMGTGSGIQAEAALGKLEVKEVYAVDKNIKAVNHCKKIIKNRKLKCLKSDLFSAFKKKKIKFDTIIFNPPYLPKDRNKKIDIALIGGKKGYETVEEFLAQAGNFLKPDGKILLLFSNLTGKHKVDELIKENGFEFSQIMSSRQFFEELYIYEITKSEILKNLESKGYIDIKYLDEGERGIVYTAMEGKTKLAIKIKKPSSHSVGRIENEGNTLKKVNKKGIGPKLIKATKDMVVYKYVEGVYLKDWLQKPLKTKLKPLLKDLLNQGRTLDKMGISKEEMHRPLTNAIVTKNHKVVLIDFERTRPTEKPHNVTQLTQFLWVWRKTLKKYGIKIREKRLRELAKAYKATPTDENFKAIISEVL
jgi:HemK-related putative methylase